MKIGSILTILSKVMPVVEKIKGAAGGDKLSAVILEVVNKVGPYMANEKIRTQLAIVISEVKKLENVMKQEGV